MFGHHVGVLDQWRPDGWFVLQRLAQEGVMRITLSTVAEGCRELWVELKLQLLLLVVVAAQHWDGGDA